MDNQVEEVKSKTDIVAIIGERVVLKKAGSNFKGLCPFHNEKSSSFMVSSELQIYKCFGCQKSGDVFTFLEEYEGMEFYEALKSLADKSGVKLKTFGTEQKGFKDRLFEINSIVAGFYHYVLLKHPAGKSALEYLIKNRKLSLETIERFNIGFSPDVALALKNYVIERKKVTLKDLSEVGLIYSSGARSFDRFRGRVIFPLFDHRGNTVGFAGRILPDNPNKDLAKYINTPETSIYKKSHVLFGLNESRAEIKKAGVAVVVEGELDMISSYQAGIKNVVAIKGSALTEEQSRLLGRFTKTIVLALDADFAGNEAAKRGIFIAEKEGLQVKVAEIKGYKDPDEAAQKEPKKLQEFIDNAVVVWDFIINFTFSKYKVIGGEQKNRIASELLPILSQIDNKITQSHYISLVASKLGVPIDAVAEEIKKIKLGQQKKTVEVFDKKEIEKRNRRELLEDRLLGLSFKVGPREVVEKGLGNLFETLFAKKIITQLEKTAHNVTISEFVKILPPELAEKFSDLILADVEGLGEFEEDKIKKEIDTVTREIKILNIKDKLEKTAQNIKIYEVEKKKNELSKEEAMFSKLSIELKQLMMV